VTVGTGSAAGSCAAAISAAILGMACFASRDQPPVSRMFTKWIGLSDTLAAPSVSALRSKNRRCSCVQAISSSSPLAPLSLAAR